MDTYNVNIIACKPEDLSSSKYYVNLRYVLRGAFNKKGKGVEIFQFFPQQNPARLPLIGYCLFSDDLILIVLRLKLFDEEIRCKF